MRSVAKIVCVGVLSGVGLAQTTSTVPPKAMSPDAHPVFEVAAIKRGDPDSRNGGLYFGGRHVHLQNQTVEWMIAFAFGVHDRQIIGAPGWVATERFDVDAVPDTQGQPSVKQLQDMLQGLLVDRFGLKTHTEKREMDVYAVTVTRGGPKLTRSLAGEDAVPTQTGGSRGHMRFTNNTMADFALGMQSFVDRPVVDRTGLTGRWNFTLNWTKDDAPVADPDAAPGLFTAVQEQLGLKLDPVKAAADVLVVDAVERPGAN